MRTACFVSWVALAALVIGQAGNTILTFEPQDFNVSAALESLGVDVSTLPDPESTSPTLNERSLFASCSLAVSWISIPHNSPSH